MPPTQESEIPSKNPTSFWIAVIAIFIAIAAILISVLNFQSTLQNKWDNKTQVAQLQQVQQQVAQSQKTQNSEVLYLVHLANMQLIIGRDPAAALKTLQFAQKQIPPTHIAFNNLINTDIAQLQSVGSLDKNTIFAEIAAINQSIQQLPAIPSQPVNTVEKTIPTQSTEKNWRDRANDFFKSLKSLFIIRHVQEPVTPLLNAQLEFAIKQNLYLQLSLSQWALMHHDAKVYQTSLQTVSNALSQYFVLTDETKPILEKLATLQKINIHPVLPSLENTLVALSQMQVDQPVANAQNRQR